MNVTIYHNAKCSKSRQALALLNDNNIEPKVIEYTKDLLSEGQIRILAQNLDCADTPRDMMRCKEADYKDNNLAEADSDGLFKAMAEYPKLIERPIVITGKGAMIARPPEKLLALL
jgi:arsenate reductase